MGEGAGAGFYDGRGVAPGCELVCQDDAVWGGEAGREEVLRLLSNQFLHSGLLDTHLVLWKGGDRKGAGSADIIATCLVSFQSCDSLQHEPTFSSSALFIRSKRVTPSANSTISLILEKAGTTRHLSHTASA